MLLNKSFVVEDELIHGKDHASEITDRFSGGETCQFVCPERFYRVDTFVCWNVRVQRRNIKGNKCSIGWEAKDVDFPKYVEKMGRVLYVGRE